MYQVSSEIYKETNFEPLKGAADDKVISKFKFHYPNSEELQQLNGSAHLIDKDGDFVVQRRCQTRENSSAVIEIEHSESTVLRLVGLQVWRGALLLADYIFHRNAEFTGKHIIELGAGVGLTSIAAAIYARKVICTDVDIGGILTLIRENVARNKNLIKNNVQVMEYDFMQQPTEYKIELKKAIYESDVVVAADVIYDDDLTDAFIRVIDFIFECAVVAGKQKTIFVALEKRYVFTLAELDTVAPMFEYFLKQIQTKNWQMQNIPIDFPQYFDYERCRHLVLLKFTKRD